MQTQPTDLSKTQHMLNRLDSLAERPSIKLALLTMRLSDARSAGDKRPSADILALYIYPGDDAAALTAQAERLYFKTHKAAGRA